jgi:hypothetical protein
MFKKLLTASAVAIAATAFGNMALAQSGEETAKSCDRDNLTQSGTLQFSMTRIGFLQAAQYQYNRNNYDRALAVCLEGRGYTVR